MTAGASREVGIEARLVRFGQAPIGTTVAMETVKRSLFDWAVCGIAGITEPVSEIVREMVRAEGGRAEATLFGGGQAPARAAALVNGTTSHALDYDDTHFAHIGHPSVAVMPAVVALAEARGISGARVSEACLVGMEASVRTGVWLGRSHYQTGFHQTATSGAIGAALACGRLLQMDDARLGHALGLVATRAAGLKAQFGTMGKPYHAGTAAANAVEAVLLADAGFVSNPEGLSGPQGFGPTHHGAGDMTALDGLGSDWWITDLRYKFHACCHGLHAMLEALAEIDVAPEAVTRVEVETHPRWLSVCNIATPRSGLEAKFSYRMTAAMALGGLSTAALASYHDGLAADARLSALADRVVVISNEALRETEAEVRVETGSELYKAHHDIAAPIATDDLKRRLKAKAHALVGDTAADRLWSAAEAGDVAALTAEMAAAG